MKHYYSESSTKPFGTYAAFQMLKEKYKETSITVLTNNFHKNWISNLSNNKGLYLLIGKNILLSDLDVDAMLNYVKNGNQLFIAGEYIDNLLLDTLGLKVEYNSFKSLFQNQITLLAPMRTTAVFLKDSSLFKKNRYSYFYYPFDTHFVNTDSMAASTLGLNENKDPNYISLVYGKGRFFFHLQPETFSNYFVLKNNNKEYFENIFGYTVKDPDVVYWDDYYRLGISPTTTFSSFTIFLKYPMLKWSLFLAMALLLFYIAFGSKRRQRPVPVKPQNSNMSVSFVETIGRLYLQKKDNYNIAHKMITYFLEHIRSHYYLNTSQLNAEFFSSLSRKTAVSEKVVIKTFQYITQLQDSHIISDEQLLDLNNQIQIFLKK